MDKVHEATNVLANMSISKAKLNASERLSKLISHVNMESGEASIASADPAELPTKSQRVKKRKSRRVRNSKVTEANEPSPGKVTEAGPSSGAVSKQPPVRNRTYRSRNRGKLRAINGDTDGLANEAVGQNKPIADDKSAKGNSHAFEPTKEERQEERRRREKSIIYLQMSTRVSELLVENPNGLFRCTLLQMYKARHGAEPPYRRLGYRSFIDAADALPVTLHLPAAGSDWVLLPLGALTPPDPPLGTPSLPIEHSEAAAPEDVLPGVQGDGIVYAEADATIAKPCLRGVAVGSALPVRLGEVYSPARLWLVRRGAAYSVALAKMMEEMNTVYGGETAGVESVLAPPARPGAVCAAPRDGRWHRAVVTHVLNDASVVVYYVDEGATATVPRRSLRPLRAAWLSPPAQAVRARLHGDRYEEGRPCAGVLSEALVGVARARDLVATVTRISCKDRVIDVILREPGRGRECIDDNLFMYTCGAKAKPTGSMFYMTPSFDLLESGLVPSRQKPAEGARSAAVEQDRAAATPPPPRTPTPPPPSTPPPPPPPMPRPRLYVYLPILNCKVYLQLYRMDVEEASQDMLDTIAYCEAAGLVYSNPSTDPDYISVTRLDCKAYGILLSGHVDTAHRLIQTALYRARPDLMPAGTAAE